MSNFRNYHKLAKEKFDEFLFVHNVKKMETKYCISIFPVNFNLYNYPD